MKNFIQEICPHIQQLLQFLGKYADISVGGRLTLDIIVQLLSCVFVIACADCSVFYLHARVVLLEALSY